MALQEVTNLVALSPLYRSAPLGPEQPDFLNAAVLLECFDSLHALLERLKRLEVQAGRVTAERWGPRPLDLDILWAEDVVITTSSLTVPHAEVCHRAFALRPLLDVFPGAREPGSGRGYVSILSKLEQQRCERMEGEKWWDEGVVPEPPE
jgi:2-amino-4-hydroxy-6-hydroxymethyldihydropteridine diphosphokinase